MSASSATQRFHVQLLQLQDRLEDGEPGIPVRLDDYGTTPPSA